MRHIVLILLSASIVLGNASLTSAQRLVLTRTFTNPATPGGDLFGPHLFGTSVGWLEGQVLVGAPGVDFGQSGQSQFLADHGMIYRFDPLTGVLLGSINPAVTTATRVQQLGFSVAGVGGQVLAGGPSVCCSTRSGAFLLDPDTGGTLVQAYEMRDVFLGLGTSETRFGFAVAPVGAAGGMAAVGAPLAASPDRTRTSGAAFIYDLTNPVPIHTLVPPPPSAAGRFGSAITAVGEDKVLIGAPGMRKAFVFQVDTGALLTTIGASNIEFGASVATVGASFIIGAPELGQGRGKVRIANQGGIVGQTLPTFPELSEPGGRFGAAVGGFGVHVLAGAPASDSAFEFVDGQGLVPIFSGITDAGVVYVNTQDGSFVGTLVSPNPQPGDMFGASIAVFGNQVLIGAPGADGGRGAVYLFEDPMPVASAQALSTSEDTPVAITLQATDNDDSIVYAIVSPPSNGTLAGTPPSLVYTPKANFNGNDTFTFTATDSAGLDSNVAMVSITVATVNDAPVALSQTVTMPANTSRTITLQAADVDGDSLSFLLLSQPGGGTLSGTPPNLTYTAKAGFLGADSFTFRANDGKALSGVATVKINVLPGLTIGDVSLKEGNSGTTVFAFTAKLSIASTQTVSVKLSTVDATAVAGQDYVATGGTLTFAPGETTQAIKVPVIGDQLFESDEAFLVVLSAPANAVIVDGTAVGTIVNDDPVLGVTALVPESATIDVRERIALDLTWTHPEAWRKLRSIDLKIADDRGVVLWVRLHEGRDTLSLVHAAGGGHGAEAAHGHPRRLETSAATLSLTESGIVKNETLSVTLRVAVSFKPSAAGRVYRVEAAATDDAGNQQGFERVGTLKVRRASRP